MRDHRIECPACGETGIATLSDEFGSYGCPADCGARFVKYKGFGGWSIRWVVEPVYRPADKPGERTPMPETCTCGHSIEEHGNDPEFPGSTACCAVGCDCIAFESDEVTEPGEDTP